jgi:hypothetical protein
MTEKERKDKISPLVFAYLLKSCPYSQKMSQWLPSSQKKWVNRGSSRYSQFKEQYQSPTYPIVLHDGKLVPGGYTTFIQHSSFFLKK